MKIYKVVYRCMGIFGLFMSLNQSDCYLIESEAPLRILGTLESIFTRAPASSVEIAIAFPSVEIVFPPRGARGEKKVK